MWVALEYKRSSVFMLPEGEYAVPVPSGIRSGSMTWVGTGVAIACGTSVGTGVAVGLADAFAPPEDGFFVGFDVASSSGSSCP